MSNWIEQTVDTILNHIFFSKYHSIASLSIGNQMDSTWKSELWFNAQEKSILGLKVLEPATIVGLNGEVATKAKRAK